MSRGQLLFVMASGLLCFLGVAAWLNSVIPLPNGKSDTGVQTWVILLGTFAAFVTFVGTSLHHDRTQKAANALTALQGLRTDKDYLERARLVKVTLGGDFSRPVSGLLLSQLLAESDGLPACANCGRLPTASAESSFVEAVDFMLNQYEFIAAAARMGAIDQEMIRQTVRSTILGILTAFEPYVLSERMARPKIWSNLAWLAAEFSPADWALHKGRLGPYPHFR